MCVYYYCTCGEMGHWLYYIFSVYIILFRPPPSCKTQNLDQNQIVYDVCVCDYIINIL